MDGLSASPMRGIFPASVVAPVAARHANVTADSTKNMGVVISNAVATVVHVCNLAVRLKAFLASKHYRQNSLGLLFANRRGRPFSANKLREKKLRPLLSSLGIPLAGSMRFDMVSLRL